ncbi:MAG: hypothetical protein HKN23_01685 [Verrucomicrobiales bacterium]|nr:hypothetical protein [Verrucomicrobiales bacterium]
MTDFFDLGRRIAVVCASISFLGGISARAQVNPTVKALMPLLRPAKASKEAKPGDMKEAQARMIRVLEFMERVEGKNGMSSTDILTNAFYIYGRDRFSGHRRMLTEGSIIRCWEKARELGLFDKNDKFGLTIRQGSDRGKKAMFEYIIPPEVNASFTTDLSNLRLVTPGEKRKKGAELTDREKGFLENLSWIEQEVVEGREDDMGRTPVENLALWKAEVEKTGEAFKNEPPLLRMGGKMMANPSSLTLNRWKVNFEVSNLSRHPVQLTVETYVYGMSKTGGKIFLLHKGKRNLQLRATHSHDFDVWTDARIGAVDFRGWVIQVRQNGKLIESRESIAGMEDLLIGNHPRMGQTGKKRRRSRSKK